MLILQLIIVLTMIVVKMVTVIMHSVKSVQVRSFFWPVFSCIRTECGPKKTPHLGTFHPVTCCSQVSKK